MSQKNIAEFFVFVILTACLAGCASSPSATPTVDPRSPYGPPTPVGRIKSPDIDEASGLAASRCQPDVLWTLNDSGGGAFLYAMRPTGESLGTWRVPNVRNTDWEDLALFKDASGRCFLYIGEIGDNKRQREERAVYRVPEPGVNSDTAGSSRKDPLESEPAEIAIYKYPDYEQNAETLLVHPLTGEMYVVTKRITGPACVYRINSGFGDNVEPATLVAEISVPAIPNGLLTGGSISPDGRRVVISDYISGYEWSLPDGTPFDEIWKQPLVTIDIGKRDTGEAICYSADGNTLYSTSEGNRAPIYQMRRK